MKGITKKVGYSGHERGISVSLGAIALGSSVIERHITEDKSLEGPDHEASLLPNEFADLIKLGNDLHLSLGEEDILIVSFHRVLFLIKRIWVKVS